MIRAVITLLAIGIGLLVFVRWLEPRFAFFPSPGESTTPSDFGVPFTATTVATKDGERLRAWRLEATHPRALVIYFHGNGGNLSIWTPILVELARHGYDVVAVDYRGYGLSTGRPTETGLYRDADTVLDHVSATMADSKPIVYWGRSLGTAVAAYAASRRPPDGIILEAGFPDAHAVLRSSPVLAILSAFSTYRFATATWLDRVECPALVLHGDTDRVMPIAPGRALFDRMEGDKMFVAIPGGDHNDVTPADPRVYWEAVDAFMLKAAARRS